MWSVVEQTALAEAEVEYEDYVSDQVWVKFPIAEVTAEFHPQATKKDIDNKQQLLSDLRRSAILIWTTTPWTIPGNRAISFSFDVEYGIYEVVDAPAGNWAKPGDRLVLAARQTADVFREARVTAYNELHRFYFEDGPLTLAVTCNHPLRNLGGYDFPVPLLPGEHVTEETGTGFVHTAPGHGREDFDIWTANAANLAAR